MEQCPGIESFKNEFIQNFNSIPQDDKTSFIITQINSILLPEESPMLNSNDRLLILDFIMDQCLKNVSSLEFDDKGFSFANIIKPILENFDSNPAISLKLFQKALIISPHLIVDHPTLLENIFLKIFQPNQNVIQIHKQLRPLKNDLLMTFLKLSVNTNNFPLFHQWYLKSVEKSRSKEETFDDEFYRFYCLKTYESHFAIVIEIWQLFLQYFDLENYYQMRLFHIFLSHVKISPDLSSKYGDLVNSTVKVLANKTSCNKNPYSLQIYYPLAFFKSPPDHPVDDESNLKLYNLSHVFPETNVEYWQEFYEQFDNFDRDSRIVFAKMMIYNYRIIKIENDSIDSKQLLHEVWIKLFDQHQFLSFDFIEFLIIELDGHPKSLLKLNDLLIDSIINSNEIAIHQNVQKILNSYRIWESRNFQNVFISVILKKLSENLEISTPNVVILTQDKFWLKHADEMPDIGNNEKHLKMINLIQQEFEAIFQEQDVCDGIHVEIETWSRIQKLLQLFVDFVPIEYISPFNQIRCVLIYFKFMVKFKKIINSGIMDLWIRANLRLWSTIRRIWFFDFISPSRYICMNIPILSCYLCYNGNQLLDSYILALFKLNDPERIFRSVEELIEFTKTENTFLDCREYVVKILGVALKHIFSYAKRSKNLAQPEHVRSMDNLLVILVEYLYENLRIYLKSDDCLKKPNSGFIIEALFELFKDEICDKVPDNRTKWKKMYRKLLKMFNEDLNILLGDNQAFRQFLKFSLENRTKLEDVLPEDFIQNLWCSIIQRFVEKGDSEFQEKVQSKTYWKRAFKCEENRKEIQSLATDFAPNSDGIHQFNDCKVFIDSIASILIPIIDFSTAEEYAMILDSCLDHCIKQDLAQAAFFIFVLSKMVQSGSMSREKALVLNERFSQIFSLSLLLLFLSNKQQSIQQNLENVDFIKVRVLESCHYGSNQLITQGLYSKVYLFSLFNVCCEVNILNCDTIESYCTIFMMINEILSDLLVKQSNLMANSICSAMDIIITLMASLIRISNENNLINVTDNEKLKLENCSKSYQRTIAKLTQIEEFRPSAFHLIAQYLELSLDGTTVVPMVKQNLITTMFTLIDMIVKYDSTKMELFYSKLNPKSKVLFQKLIEHHNQYYRFKGYV